MGAMFDLQTGRSFEGADANMFPLGTTKHHTYKNTKITEGRGPGGLSPVDLWNRTTAGEPDYGPWTRVETES